MKIAGIDCGVKGSCALLDTEADSAPVFFDIPLNDDRQIDTHALFTKLLEFEPDVVVTEFTFKPISLIQQTGEVMAVAKILQCHLEVVAVSRWKTAVLGTNTSDKEVSITRAQALYPTAEFVKPRCRTVSPDRCEAALLAHWYLQSTTPRKRRECEPQRTGGGLPDSRQGPSPDPRP